ncbi:MAG: SusC/RagA family TonB-linked outer membrane protein [Candidatus Cryptobacteroides sp.]
MKSKLFTCLAMLFLSFSLMGQTKVVKGVVSDNVGPVYGASVLEKGTMNGAITDLDGNFSLSVPKGAVIVVSSIGFKDVEILIGDQDVYNVTLEEDRLLLDDVVVVGYGVMKKSDFSGASASMKESDLKATIVSSLDQSLQGRVAGVQAVQTSGAPGSSSAIRVRGQATINANAEPLYVIDGVIVQGGGNRGADFGLGDALGNGTVSTISPLSTINTADIVSMEILKDASATAIYGAQGANGVVLITTKRGKAGEGKVTYDGMVAVSRQTKRLDMMNLREFAEYYNDLLSIGEINQAQPNYANPSLLGTGTNWQDAIFRTAIQHQHQLGVSGGSDKVQYYVSGSYMNQEGTIIGSNFDRFSMRSNLDAQVKDWLKVGANLSFTNTNDDLKLADSNEGLIYYSLTTLPDIPIYDVDGNFSSTVREGYTSPNPIAMAMYDDILLNRQKFNGSFFADINLLKNLTWHSEIGFDFGNNKAERYKPMVDLGGWVRSTNESSISMSKNIFWQLKNYLTYVASFGKHNITAMLGQECWESRWTNSSIFNSGLPSDEVHNPALGTGKPTIGYGFGSSAMASFFTRETYNYDNRYYLTYTYRYDGSSNFGPDNRWAGFHSVAASWRFSNEGVFSDSELLSNGKLRAGWGQTGNANIGGYAWGSAMSKMPSGLGMGYRPANIPNTAIKWEKQEQLNIGLDLGFFQDKFNITVDAYKKISSDMLMQMQLPSYMGTQGNGSSALAAPKGNYGSIENRGLEFTLDIHPLTGEFRWDSNFQVSVNRNKLLSLSGTENAALVGYGQWTDVVCVSEVGQSLYNFYGYVVEGVYTDIDDIQNSPLPVKFMDKTLDEEGNTVYLHKDVSEYNRNNTVWVGDLKFKDLNGDGTIDENDRTVLGSPLPLFTFGWTNTFSYKNIDLSIFINGSYGNKVLNYNSMGLTHMNSPWTNQLNSVSGRARLVPVDPSASEGNWYDDITNVRVENTDARIPRPTVNDPNDNDRMSSRYIEDASYLRIKNITLGYTFPKSLLAGSKIENCRVYVNIQNLYTLTNYTGYDPEVGASTQDSTGLSYGVDNGRYPSPTMCSFGLNITF